MFQKLLNLAVTNSFFLFNGQLYRQRESLGMGLPLSLVIADIFMDFYEQKWLADCPAEFAPLYYKRYVDDCFLVFRNEQHAPRFLNYLSSKHRNISFTMEVENNKQLPFLDVLITKCDNSFSTTVYRKPTFSGLGSLYI